MPEAPSVQPSPRKSLRVRGLRSCLLLCLFGAGLFLPLRGSYRGLALGTASQLRHGTLTESRNLLSAIAYWLEFMQKLQLEPETRTYDLPASDPNDDFERGRLALHRGELTRAVEFLESSLDARGESEAHLFWLAMAYLRLAEASNCGPESGEGREVSPSGFCSLPIRARHLDGEPARAAARSFQRLLEHYAPEDLLYRWLLSFCYMVLDEYPEGVPPHHRIETPFTSYFYEDTSASAPRLRPLELEDRAASLGVDTFNAGRGVAVEDFDRDGFLDLVTGGSFDDVRYYRNVEGRTFEDQTEAVGLGGIRQPFFLSAADYDNDGWIDLFVARPFHHYVLLRNLGNGTFSDTTATSGLLAAMGSAEVAATWVSAWGDVDNDGDLDLFLAQWAFRLPFTSGLMARERMDSRLFVNEGGVFSDATERFGLGPAVEDRYLLGAAFGDYDNDGFTDLFVSSPLRGSSLLLHNLSGRRFTPSDLVEPGSPGFVTAWLDADHDGRLDLFRGGFADARTSTELAVFGRNHETYRSGHSTLDMQQADGRFVRDLDRFEDAMPMGTMGASYGDLDNDGCADFYLGTGNPESWFVLPNLLYLGIRDGTRCTARLANHSRLDGVGSIQKGHGIVFFDFDNDGDQDLYSSLGGMWPGDRWPNQLFVNLGEPANRWIKLRLRGRHTNRYGVGARIRVVARDAAGRPIVRHHSMDNKTGFGSSPYIAHIGLLDAVEIETLEVFWPVTRCRQRYNGQLETLQVLDEAACSRPEREEAVG